MAAVGLGVAFATGSYWALVAADIAGGVTLAAARQRLRADSPALARRARRSPSASHVRPRSRRVAHRMVRVLERRLRRGRAAARSWRASAYSLAWNDRFRAGREARRDGDQRCPGHPVGGARTCGRGAAAVPGDGSGRLPRHLPLSVGLAVIAEPLVYTVLGAKWAAAVAPLRLLSLALMFRSLAAINPVVLLARRETYIDRNMMVLFAIVTPLLFVAGARGGMGVRRVAVRAAVAVAAPAGALHLAQDWGLVGRLGARDLACRLVGRTDGRCRFRRRRGRSVREPCRHDGAADWVRVRSSIPPRSGSRIGPRSTQFVASWRSARPGRGPTSAEDGSSMITHSTPRWRDAPRRTVAILAPDVHIEGNSAVREAARRGRNYRRNPRPAAYMRALAEPSPRTRSPRAVDGATFPATVASGRPHRAAVARRHRCWLDADRARGLSTQAAGRPGRSAQRTPPPGDLAAPRHTGVVFPCAARRRASVAGRDRDAVRAAVPSAPVLVVWDFAKGRR